MEAQEDHHEYCTGGFGADDIVITGVAGRFPSCKNVGKFKEGLFAKKNFFIYTDERYKKGECGVNFSSCAIIDDLDKFDNDFFCTTSSAAAKMNPAQRMLQEVCYEAIADSGYDPYNLKGANIGIYNATSDEDYKETVMNEASAVNPLLSCGLIRPMNANRCSYSFDFHGPSFTVDSACSSSGVALWCAVNDIREGRVEAAVVSGCQMNCNPAVAVMYSAILSPTGTCTPFDAEANGIVRSEACCALFLQKAPVARRAYATILAVNHLSAGFVADGITVPSLPMQIQLSQMNLTQAGLSAEAIDYVEAHGTGTAVGDPIELNAIAEVYHRNRKDPLHVGTIKSNVGHSEASSGITSLVKAILAFETGMIPPNVGYRTPNPACPVLVTGKIKVVTDLIPLTSSYIPVNNFGIGGALVQTVLKRNPITARALPVSPSLPQLVLYPATTEAAISHFFNFLENAPDLREEFFALVRKLSFTPVLLKPYRGYTVLHAMDKPVTQIKNCFSDKRQVWFVMTGMGCQWPGMGLQLMEIEVFARSMRNSAKVLKPFGIDLLELLRKDANYLMIDRNIVNAFITITSIQVALIDLLKAVQIHPDGILGHSTGEISAAYADGSLTAEQAVLSAYWRGKSIECANLPQGGMAAVGLSWEEAKKRCPAHVYPACHNADDSVTISGLKKPLEDFVDQLQKENVFARSVNVYGYAFHCKLVHPAAEMLRTALTKLIPNPKPRTKRWLSSSFLENEWDEEACKTAGPDYFTHNLMSNVHFNEVVKKIPQDAITIEIGPHFLLQAVLKKVIGSRATYIGLMKRNEENNMAFLLESLGKLYTEGLNPKIENLYPPVKFPVPRSTPMISDLIKWNHSQTFHVLKWSQQQGSYVHTFNLGSADSFLKDHRIDGRSLFPAAGYIFLAWNALATKNNVKFEDIPVVIEDFKIHRAVILNDSGELRINVTMQGVGGHFEIIEGNNTLLSSGKIRTQKNILFVDPEPAGIDDESSAVSGAELYNELRIRGYEYGPAFQGLLKMNLNGTRGTVLWNGNWITFLDSLLLFFGFTNDSSDLYLPTGAQSLKIDPSVLKKYIAESEDDCKSKAIPVSYNIDVELCSSVGVEIRELVLDPAPRRAVSDGALYTEYKFMPYIHNYVLTKNSDQKLSSYKFACNEILDKMGQTFQVDVRKGKFPDNDLIDLKLNLTAVDENSNYTLLSVLKRISELDHLNGFVKESKEIFQSYVENIGKDILNSVLIDESPLRTMLDIISENTYRKLSLLEMSHTHSILLPTVVDIFRKYSLAKVKSSVLVTSTGSFAGEEIPNGVQLRSPKDMDTLLREKNQDVVMSWFTCGTAEELKLLVHNLSSVVKPSGFILLHCKCKTLAPENFLSSLCRKEICIVSESELQITLEKENLFIVSRISDSFGGSLFLLRHFPSEEPRHVVRVQDDQYDWLRELKEQLSADVSDAIWLVSDDVSSGIIGMVNCLKREPGGERIRCAFIPRKNKKNGIPPFSFEATFYKDLLKRNVLMNVWRDGAWGSFRHLDLEKEKPLKEVKHSFINCAKYGDLSSFQWKESAAQYKDSSDKDIVHIYYAPLNFRDVMLATGKLSVGTAKVASQEDECVLGIEFAGRRPCGQRVAGFLRCRGLATEAVMDADRSFNVPDHWTLEEAATVPVVYGTCYYALLVRAQMQRGESILIHSGTGGIGLAAITLALDYQCEIFTTVGNEQKREYLMKKFPQLNPANIGCSRDISFEDMIKNRTGGKGVNIVLNSLADEKFQASLRCVARHGRFVEIGKYDLTLDRPIGLKVFLKNINFIGVTLDNLFDGTPTAERQFEEMMRLLNENSRNNTIKPLDRTVFGRDEAEKAFRYMASGTHVGKVLIKIRDEEPLKVAIPKPLRLLAVPNTHFYDRKVYIIVGGLGGFGIELTKWMIGRGAKHVILTSRYGVRTPYHRLCMKRWTKGGFDVRVSTMNIVKKEEAEKLLLDASQIGPVGAIFNSAVVLRDAFIENQNETMFKEACEPKASGTRHLDELSRKLCPSLDYFVCFSSISCGRGNAGQSNYGYANSVMERICEERRASGLHGLGIQWGIIGDVGLVHRHMGDDAVIAGVCAQSLNSCLKTLDVFCQLDSPVVSSYVSAELSVKPKTAKDDIVAKILNILGVQEISDSQKSRTFLEMGIDSMVGTELIQLLDSSTDLSLTVADLQQLKLDDLIALLDKAEGSKETDTKSEPLAVKCLVNVPGILEPTKPIVHLNSVATGTPVYIVTMGDIDVSHLRALGENISKPVFASVWTRESPATDMESLAASYLEVIKKSSCGPFHLVGFSSGGSLAFEMALQDEAKSRNVKTFSLLDGSATLVNAVSGGETISEVATLCKFVELLIPGGIPKLEEDLERTNSLDQRITIITNILMSCSSEPMDKNNIFEAIHAFLNKSNLAQTYVPKIKLLKDITVIEDSSHLLANDVSEFKTTLSEVCSGKIFIYRRVLELSQNADKGIIQSITELLNTIFGTELCP